MGCWAVGSFGNDDAADWLYALTTQNDLSLARETIAMLLGAEGYLDASYATEALAAVEVVAAALGRPTAAGKSEEKLIAWISRIRPAPETSLVLDSVRAVDRILSPESELRDLWEDTEDFALWQAEVAGLRANLLA